MHQMMTEQTILYLGKQWPVQANVSPKVKKVTLTLQREHLLLEAPEGGKVDYTKALITFYKKQAKRHIEQRLRHFQPMIGKKYHSYVVESHMGRWGSCNGRGELTFHWNLMMLSEALIDYVIIHELCHLTHLNHDRSFWRLVGKFCPNYKELSNALPGLWNQCER